MQVAMPNGTILDETFETMEELAKRKRELERRGGKVQKISIGRRTVFDRSKGNPKYPRPHQGKAEITRRKRQIERGQLQVS